MNQTLAPMAMTASPTPKKAAKKKRRRWPWIVGITTLLLVGGVAASKSRAKAAPIDASALVTVSKKNLEVDILDTGRITPREKADIKSRVAGQVQQVLVSEGAHVKKGDTLIVLDPTDYTRDVARTEAEVAQATAALDFAKLNKERAERGAAEGVAPKFEVATTTNDERARTNALRAAEVAKTVAQDRMRYTRITSPIDGTIIVRGIEPGEAVVPGVQSTFDGKSLLTVADLSVLLVKVNLNQIDVAKIAVGKKATLTLDALPGKKYEAVVTKVAPASIKLAGKEQEVFPVEAQIDAPDGLIKPGMTADIRVHLDAKPNVLSLPIEAVLKEAGRSYVMKVESTDPKKAKPPQKVEVTTGMRNDREVEIVSGIEEGAKVLLKPPVSENEMKL